MTWAAVSLFGPWLAAGNLDPMQKLSGSQITHFEAQQSIHVDEAKGLTPINRERADDISEWTDGQAHFVGFGVHYGKDGRLEAGQVHLSSILSLIHI